MTEICSYPATQREMSQYCAPIQLRQSWAPSAKCSPVLRPPIRTIHGIFHMRQPAQPLTFEIGTTWNVRNAQAVFRCCFRRPIRPASTVGFYLPSHRDTAAQLRSRILGSGIPLPSRMRHFRLQYARHLVPSSSVKNPARSFLEGATPLLEEEGDFAFQTVVTDFSHPIRIHRPSTRSRFTTNDNPINSIQLNSRQRPQKWFKR